jgi:hypothetical protein
MIFINACLFLIYCIFELLEFVIHLEFGDWNLEFIWYLVLGFWNFLPLHSA